METKKKLKIKSNSGLTFSNLSYWLKFDSIMKNTLESSSLCCWGN